MKAITLIFSAELYMHAFAGLISNFRAQNCQILDFMAQTHRTVKSLSWVNAKCKNGIKRCIITLA